MKAGLFLMPLHDPKGNLAAQLKEDRECILLADELGFAEAWVGEHYCSRTEPIPDPLQFMASLVHITRNIKFGTAVLNMPQHHPVQVAGNAALFDHLSNGRFIMGVGPGGLQSDMEMFGTRDKDRNAMLAEAMKIVRMLWMTEPPYIYKGEFWDIRLEKTLEADMGIGPVILPLQRPHPPVAVSVISPRSATAVLAGEMGWGLVSGNFMPASTARLHWDCYCEGAQRGGVEPDRGNWRLSRSLAVTETESEAAEYLANPNTSLRWYYQYLHHSLSAKNLLPLFKRSPDVPDAEVSVERLLRDIVIYGSVKTVTDRMIAIIDEVGPFGTLLVAKKEWDDPAFHRRSYRLLAEKVMPVLSAHVASLGQSKRRSAARV